MLLFVTLGAPSMAQLLNSQFSTGDLSNWSHGAFTEPQGSNLVVTQLPYGVTPSYGVFRMARDSGGLTTDSNGVVQVQTANFDGNGPFTSSIDISPLMGSYMAYISNHSSDALANGNILVGSWIEQVFLVPNDAINLQLSARYLSNEGLDNVLDVNGQISGADFGGVALVRAGTSLQQYTFDAHSNSLADFHVSNFSVDGSTGFGGFISGTDWRNLSFDLSPYRGQMVELVGYTINTGDTLIESRLLVGGSTITTSGDPILVPEPDSLLYVAAVFTCLCIVLSVRKFRADAVKR